MKKLLVLVMVIALAATAFACTPADGSPDASPSPEVQSPDVETPDAETPDAETPDVETPGDAEPVPAEIADAGAMDLGVWPLASGTYDPSLDAENIPEGAQVYGFFDAMYTNIDLPETVSGYEAAGSAAEVAPGKFAALVINNFNYLVIMPVSGAFEPLPVAEPPANNAPSDMPAEIAGAGAMYLGVWPLASGTYDPSLDAENIPEGAQVYGFFDAMYTNIDFPAAIEGYTAVGSAAEVTAGTFAPITVNNYNYVILMP